MSDTATTFDGMLKNVFDEDKVMNLIYDDNVFLNMVSKNPDFRGDAYKVPVVFGGNNAIGANFTVQQAQSQASSQQVTAFLLPTPPAMYGICNWARQVMLQSETTEGAFEQVAKVNLENVLKQFGNQLATVMYRSGYGDQGQVNATVQGTAFSNGGTTLQLQSFTDIYNFEEGMTIQFSAVQGGTVRAGTIVITGVDTDNAILTFGAAISSTITGAAAGDYLYVYGNAANGAAAGSLLVPTGIEGWIPATVPSVSDSFFGVNRSKDNRLSGRRLNGTTGQSIEQLIITAAQKLRAVGGRPSHFFLDFNNYNKLLLEQQGRVINFVEPSQSEKDMGLNYRGLHLVTAAGDVEVVPDRTCPGNRIYGLQLDTWELATTGKMVQVVEEDGLQILRVYNADNYESRYAFYGQLVCKAPGYNINIAVPAN
jgi:hypothetical protein